MDPFQKEMEDKFMKDLQNIQIGDSDSELQSSTDFYQALKQKIHSQITSMRASTTKNTILEQLKANLNKEITNVQKFQHQIHQMKILNTTANNAIAQQKIEEIKTKLAKQNLSHIVLADQQVDIRQKQLSKIQNQTNSLQESALFQKDSSKPQNQDKNFKKKLKTSSLNVELDKKINQANLERERISMEREDDLSNKYEQFRMSEFFKERFEDFMVPKTEIFPTPHGIKITKPKSTFTNLSPLPNNEKNVLPKNSPEIALKNLKKNKKISLAPTSQATIKIQFKKIEQTINPQYYERRISSFKNLNVSWNHNFNQFLTQFLKQAQEPIGQLQKISSLYKPKFIKNYLSEDQKISNIDISQTSGSQRSIQQIMAANTQEDFESQKNNKKLKEFKLTFQKVTSLKGIECFSSVEYLALQFNLIKNLNEINLCSKIIEINLSNNCIKDAKALSKLTSLRYLNLSNNKVSEFGFEGGSLQILKLKSNNIEVISDLNKNRFLRYIDVSENKLHELGSGFCKLHSLQELNLQKNYVSSLKGCQNLVMLQKLNVSHNRIKEMEKSMVLLFLNYLDVSYNQIEKVCDMFLPSLQNFYFTNNKLTGKNITKTVVYLPELKQFNIDDNQIRGFSVVWFFIRFSKKLEIIKYDSNEYFLSVREKVRQLYEAIIYKNIKNIKILNHSPYDSGIKAYYESAYNSYLDKGSKLSLVNSNFQKVSEIISFLVQQNKMIANLQTENHKHQNQRFNQQNPFIEAKSVKRAHYLHQVLSMLSLIPQNRTPTNSPQIAVIKIQSQIYNHHDTFQLKILKKLHKIKSLFFKINYKNNKKIKYFQSKKSQLLILLIQISQMVRLNSIRKVVAIFSKALKQNKQEIAAIIIQKNWRGYRQRKFFKKMMSKIKQKNNDDSFDLEQVDLDEFQTHDFPEFDFQLPDDVNFQNFIIEPKYFEIAQQKNKKRNSKANQKLPQINQKKQEEYNPMMNNFMKQEKVKQDKHRKKQEDERLMKEWGFQNPASLEALRWKKKRKEEMKRKEAEQNMNAAQRYEKFKMMHK